MKRGLAAAPKGFIEEPRIGEYVIPVSDPLDLHDRSLQAVP
jgi:hypothetical protein